MSDVVAAAPILWAKLIDHTRCIGCHACSTACKSENEVPLSVNRTYVKYVDIGVFPVARRAFQVTRCNQCERAPCVAACPTAAMYRRDDGIVDFDKRSCIGCKACIAACPYDAIFINPADHAAEKCNFCAHRLDVGLEPACVVVCPTQAILVGDLREPASPVARAVQRDVVHVRRPEKDTRPKVFYKGAHQYTLDPLAAVRPDGGLFMWSEQWTGPQHVVSGHPDEPNSSAAALLSYDVPHRAPWDWRVSFYTWTKSIASGVYLFSAFLVLLGLWAPSDIVLWGWITPVLAATFLGLTGAILIWDLEHPSRFYYLFTRAQPTSWLVKGGCIITAYGIVLALHVAAAVAGRPDLLGWLLIPGVPLAAMTAVYTAYLFGQAKARDLWQSPMLAPHLFVQAGLAGAAVLVPVFDVTGIIGGRALDPLLWALAALVVVHLGFVTAEVTFFHPTAHAKLAVSEMVWGRYRLYFWISTFMMLGAAGVPFFQEPLGPAQAWIIALAPVLALAGLLAYEHAYVQAGQSVPLS